MNFVQRFKAAGAVLFGTKAMRLQTVDDSRGWFTLYDYNSSYTAWQRDMFVDRESVLSNWTIFSCASLIASDIGKVSWRLMEKEGEIWSPVDVPAFSPVLRKPNGYQTRQQFMEIWSYSKILWGNTYVLKERDQRGVVVGLYVLDPCRVKLLISDNGEIFYELSQDEISKLREPTVYVPASEIIHDRFNCLFHPLVGLSPIFASGLAATQGLKIQNNSSKFFENMSRPSGILTAPGAISQATADRLRDSWESNYTGDKMGKVAVLGDDLKYQPLGVNAADSQVVEQLKLSAEMICSTFHIPAFKIGAGTIPAGQKVEDLNQIYYSDCLHALMDAIQTLISEGLGLDVDYRSVKFDLDDLLKMDSATQIAVIKQGIDAAVLSPNEGRRKLNLPPVSGGEAPLSQQQNWSLAQLADRGAIPDAASVAAPANEEEPEDEIDPEMVGAAAAYEFRKALNATQ